MLGSTLLPTLVSTKKFLWFADKRKFVADISDLGIAGFGRVWPDSCDEGLTLVSHWTGKQSTCVVTHEEIRDGDLLYWELAPVDSSAGDFTVTIFND